MAGNFDWLNGPRGNSGLAILNAASTLYPGFILSEPGRFIDAVARQTNGNIVFVSSAAFIKRCNASGTVDPNFNFSVSGGTYERVKKIVVQPDGKILIAGNFTNVAGFSRRGLARIIPADVPPVEGPLLSRFSLHAGNVIRFWTDIAADHPNPATWTLLYSSDIAAAPGQWETISQPIVYRQMGYFETTDPGWTTNPPVRFYRLSYGP